VEAAELKSRWKTHFNPKEAMMKFSGIDLHSNNSVVVVSNEEDRIVYQRRLPNDLQQILRHWRPIVKSWVAW